MTNTQASDQKWTVLRLLQWTTEYFQKHGSDSARLDAEVLLAHARDCSRIELYTAFEEEPDDEQRAAFRELVRRRGEGTPVAQLVGYKEFYSLRFRVNEHTLIPRPETEHLVIEALDCAKSMSVENEPLQVADIGTGSGAIAVSFAAHHANSHLTASDISDEAIAVAKWNAQQHSVDDRIEFINSDLFANIESPGRFDLICSNPPYISESEFAQLDRDVRDHEPKSALVASDEGTAVIKRLITDSCDRLKSGGRLIIELSPMIADACLEYSQQFPEWVDARFVKDLAGNRRILSLLRG